MEDIRIYDTKGQDSGPVVLKSKIQKRDLSPKIYACAVHVLLQNWRQGTVGCKGRSDVSLSNRKPWKQKGTGRARAGTARSPLWRGGGVTFGPQPRTRSLKLSKGQKTLVLNNLFFSLYEKNSIHCLDFDNKTPSTQNAFKMLKYMKLSDKKVVVLLDKNDTVNFASFRNIPNVSVFYFDQPNVYDLSHGNSWLFLKKNTDQFNEMISKWN